MACRGCSQAGDCACVITGDGSHITVTGTGSAGDPYVVNLNESAVFTTVPNETHDVCTTTLRVLVKKVDNSVAFISLPKPCARIL